MKYLFISFAYFSLVLSFFLLICKSFKVYSRYNSFIIYVYCKIFIPFLVCLSFLISVS